MLLSQAKLGDRIIIYLTDGNYISHKPTLKTMVGTYFANSGPNRTSKEYLIGWKDGETHPMDAERRNGKPASSYEYVADQALFTVRGFGYHDTIIAGIAPPLRIECPCGIFRQDCDYHKVSP